ncbi:MAG: radical SAM family heme chaperone HemW [Anaerolineales bacterium]
MNFDGPYSIYVHIPFCRHRCGYCDFNTYAGQEGLIDDYISALCREIDVAAASLEHPLTVHTIFFGGGTPSLLTIDQLERALNVLRQSFHVLPEAEISLEANPGTLSRAYLWNLRSIGVNRLSLGVQSANPAELRLLERQHDFGDAIQAVAWARQAGFDNLNLDLIFGLPGQRLETWQSTLEHTLRLDPDHLALYALTLEHGTPFGRWAERGLLSEPDPDEAAEMYELASERLAQAGFEQYEISNWGRRMPGGEILACRHNLQYWRNLPYLGFGAGAHGYAADLRSANVLAPAAYIRRCRSSWDPTPAFPRTPATHSLEIIDEKTEMGETMMMGLRLIQEGVGEESFRKRFGRSLDEVYGQEIRELCTLGLLEWAADGKRRLRLTPRGRLLGNQVFYRFI